MLNVLAIVRLIAAETNLSAYDALMLADRIADLPPLDTPAPLTVEQHARLSPIVCENLRQSKKIQAIKELRAITNCSLVEAKNAVEGIAFDVAPDIYFPNGARRY